MNSIVLIKQVPEMERVVFDREKGVIDRSSAGTQINPFDLNALQAALDIRERCGGNVKVLSMGPPSCETALREALARGADEAFLACDKQFGGSDVKATSVTLAAAVKAIGSYDLILAGIQTIDGDTGQVGPEVAQLLDIPHACYAEEITEISENHVTVRSSLWEGEYLLRLKLPALITVTKDINTPKLPLLKRHLQARNMPINRFTSDMLNLSEEETGFLGSPTHVKKIVVPPAAGRRGMRWRGDDMEGIEILRRVIYGK